MSRPSDGEPPLGEDWDGGEWVDVGPDGRWQPTAGERIRAVVVIAVALGVLGMLAAVASVGDTDEDVVADTTTTSSTLVPTTEPTTTELADPTSVGGEPPPEPCVFDDRNGAALRDRGINDVLVLNGTPRGGHAGSVSDDLRDLGYRLLEPGNASRRQVTLVEYRPGSCAEGHRLIADLAIPGTLLQAMEPGSDAFNGRADLQVTLGRDSLGGESG